MQSGSYWSFRAAAEIPDYEEPEYDKPDFLRVTRQRAAKRHLCDACKTPIEQGELYQVTALKIEGEFIFERRHITCPENRCRHEQTSWNSEDGWRVERCEACNVVLDHEPDYAVLAAMSEDEGAECPTN
jgi:hypothetical protein